MTGERRENVIQTSHRLSLFGCTNSFLCLVVCLEHSKVKSQASWENVVKEIRFGCLFVKSSQYPHLTGFLGERRERDKMWKISQKHY